MTADDFTGWWFTDPADKASPSSTAHTEGYRARMAGKSVEDNQYGLGTDDHKLWRAGWLECAGEENEEGV